MGLFFTYIALAVGTFFFLYAMKYYITLALVLGFSRKAAREEQTSRKKIPERTGLATEEDLKKKNGLKSPGVWYRLFGRTLNGGGSNGNGFNGNGYNGNGFYYNHYNSQTNGIGMVSDYEQIALKKQPFVSIHLAFYNEKKVANRILSACTDMDYDNYEVVVVDDSTDETTKILEKWKRHPKVKIIHRANRAGFKGGALQVALENSDPRTEFICVFDADFIPYPDTIWQFLKYFNIAVNGNNNHKNNHNHIENGDYKKSKIAAVQGYQWHVLNKNENWITRGIRAEFAGSYVVERPGTEVIGSMKLIAGSVYMIRADLLRKYGWQTSITEDFQLTLRLYADGYRVIYTPYIQAPSECVATIKRLIRQRMRWSEGHTHQVKKMFWKILRSPFLKKREKLEFLYLAPYYLQSAFFLIGTLSWFVSDAVFQTPIPFWTALWGWCLVLTNMFALPLMNGVGLFLEESPRKDYLGLFSFVLLSYILVPFQAYAAVKGLFEEEEGHWFRTPKSGHITDTFLRSRFRRVFEALFPSRGQAATTAKSPELALATANNRFTKFGIRPYKLGWISDLVLGLVIVSTVFLLIFAPLISTIEPNQSGQPNLTFMLTKASATSKEEIVSQMMTSFSGAEAIFHREPRVRYKLDNAEVELTALSAKGLGKIKETVPYREGPLFVYPEIFEGADLIYKVKESRVFESLLLKKYQPIEYFEERIRLLDLVLAKDDQGQIAFAPKEGGAAVFHFKKPSMYERDNPQAKSEAIIYELEKKGSDYILRKTLTEEGKKWLADPQRQYPVIIDPTIYRSNVSTGIASSEATFGSNQRKIAYMPNATGGAAWYAFHADGQIIRYKKCFASSLCDADADWSANVAVDVNGDAGDGNPNIFVQGNYIWIFWIDNTTAGTASCCTAVDSIQWRRLDTTADSFNQECSSDDQGTLDYTNFAYGAVGSNGDVVGGYSDTAGDAEADIFEVPSGTDCSAAPLNTDVTYTIESGSGLPTGTTTMRPVALGISNNIHVVYDDAANEIRHSLRDVSSNSWVFADKVADNGNVYDDIFSVTTDGSSLWLLYRDTATTTVLQKCTGTCMTSSGGAWSNLTAPWTSGLTSADYPNIGYMSTENDLKACINDGAATTTQDVVCKSTDASTISWGSQFNIGFTSSDYAELSLTMSVGNADQMAMVVHDVTNTTLRFATVPERIIYLLGVLPAAYCLLKKKRRGFKCKAV